jgi:hypothetical protein
MRQALDSSAPRALNDLTLALQHDLSFELGDGGDHVETKRQMLMDVLCAHPIK